MKLTYAMVVMVWGIAYGLSGAGVAVWAQGTTQWDRVYTLAQAKRGQAAYADGCESCHGSDLTGGEVAPGLAGPEFMSNWNTLSVGDLVDRTRETMPQDRPGSLSRTQATDIVAFILSKNNAPAGETELSSVSDQLSQIKLTTIK